MMRQNISFIFKQDQTGLDRSARSTLDLPWSDTPFTAVWSCLVWSQGLKVSRSQGLKVTTRGVTRVTGVTGMKVNVIFEAFEVIIRVQ